MSREFYQQQQDAEQRTVPTAEQLAAADGYTHEHDNSAPYGTLNELVRLHRQATLLASLTSFETVADRDMNWSKQVEDVWLQIVRQYLDRAFVTYDLTNAALRNKK